MKAQGYTRQDVDRRRAWLEAKTGGRFTHVGAYSIPSEEMRGNIENPIGAVQMPLGVAGPLLVHGTTRAAPSTCRWRPPKGRWCARMSAAWSP